MKYKIIYAKEKDGFDYVFEVDGSTLRSFFTETIKTKLMASDKEDSLIRSFIYAHDLEMFLIDFYENEVKHYFKETAYEKYMEK